MKTKPKNDQRSAAANCSRHRDAAVPATKERRELEQHMARWFNERAVEWSDDTLLERAKSKRDQLMNDWKMRTAAVLDRLIERMEWERRRATSETSRGGGND